MTDRLGVEWKPGELAEPHQEVSREEFAAVFYMYPPEETRYDFIERGKVIVMYSIYPDAVYAVVRRWWHTPGKFPGVMIKGKSGVYLYLQFYRIGCTHPNMQMERQGMHEYTMHCPDCGFTRGFDSS